MKFHSSSRNILITKFENYSLEKPSSFVGALSNISPWLGSTSPHPSSVIDRLKDYAMISYEYKDKNTFLVLSSTTLTDVKNLSKLVKYNFNYLIYALNCIVSKLTFQQN